MNNRPASKLLKKANVFLVLEQMRWVSVFVCLNAERCTIHIK
jgi:hypothetical protein